MPRRLPKKLFNICNDYISSFIVKFVLSLPRETEVDEELQTFQEHILKYVCPRLVDNLLLTVAPCWVLNDNQKVMLLKILTHPSMITFSTKFKLPTRDNFYELRLKELKNLVVLNLSMVCTDEILEVVGAHCRLLQVIHIVSKIGSVTCKTKRQLNALKLKFFVSDKGLEHLHNCKFLKTIIMNRVTRSNCGGRKITHDGIRKLLRALPELQFISYNDMGLVIEDDIHENEKFNLLHLHDSHIKPEHIDHFVKHCPKIKGLCLMLPTDVGYWNPEACLYKLANSELKISSLALRLFPANEAFNNFLSVKGVHLTNLCLCHDITINVETIYFIGLNCPYLEYLEVHFVIPGDQDDDTLKAIKNKKMFTYLQSLKILGSLWNPQIIFQLCISNALYLNHLTLLNRDYCKNINELILNLLISNPLVKLRHVTLLDGFCVGINTLLKFVLSIENLESIMVSNKSYIYFLEQLKIEYNLNLSIKSDCMIGDDNRNYGNCLCYYWQKGSLGIF